MLKIHPGFKAIAILAGPAALIAGFHSLYDYFTPRRPYDPAIMKVMQELYSKCSEVPKLQRTVRCDEYVTYFDRCMRSETQCTLTSSYNMLTRLEFSPPPLRLPPTEVAVGTMTD